MEYPPQRTDALRSEVEVVNDRSNDVVFVGGPVLGGNESGIDSSDVQHSPQVLLFPKQLDCRIIKGRDDVVIEMSGHTRIVRLLAS